MSQDTVCYQSHLRSIKGSPDATMHLHYDIHHATGPYLLMVHGFLSSRAQCGPNLVALASVARPVVLELWGHGRSPAPANLPLYHPDASIAAFDRLRTQRGVERWCLCGQSFEVCNTAAVDFLTQHL
jgi:pimeloyl-ACP methyl ester carboxylesterase